MAGYLFANNAQSRIIMDTSHLSATVTVDVGDGAKFPQPVGDGSNWFMLTLEDRRTGQIEICKATGRSGDIINVTRGQEGTAAQDFALGATASNRMTVGTFTTFVASVYTKTESDAKYVDAAGDTMTGPLVLSANPTTGPQAANKAYVDLQVALINGIAEPTNDTFTYGRAFGVWNRVLTKTQADAADATLQTNINTVQTNLNTTNTTVGTQGTHLTTIDGQITALQGTDTSLQSQITTLGTTKLSDAPSDGKAYGRFNGAWAEVSQGGGALGEYNWSATITAPGLAAGELRFNNASPALVTSIFCSVTSALGIDLTTLFRVMTPGTTLFFQVKGDNTKYQAYNVIAAPVIAAGVVTLSVVSKLVGANLVAGRVLAGSPGGGGAGLAAMSDTPPANPQNGQMWWQSSTGVLYLFFDDGTSTQWVQADAPPTSPATDLDMVGKNILNAGTVGAATINASAVNVAAINGGPLAGLHNLVVNGSFRVNQRAFAGGALTVGVYGYDRWKADTGGVTYTVTAGVATITAGALVQVVEGANIEVSGAHTLSWVGTATAQINGVAVLNGGNAALTAGTNATIRFTGGTVSNVQLERGTQATPFESRPIPMEFAFCQRYYETGVAQQTAWSGAGQNFSNYTTFIVRKRGTPAVGVSFSYSNGSTGTAISVSTVGFVNNMVTIGTASQTAFSNSWTADAEL